MPELHYGQLWQPCLHRGCNQEPVCVNCESCARHCTCPPPPTPEEEAATAERLRLRHEAVVAARAEIIDQLVHGADPCALPIERKLSNGMWTRIDSPERVGYFLGLVLQREPWRAPRDNRAPMTDGRQVALFLARGNTIHYDSDWYAELRLQPAPKQEDR